VTSRTFTIGIVKTVAFTQVCGDGCARVRKVLPLLDRLQVETVMQIISKWFNRKKTVRSKHTLTSPRIAQIFAVSLVALIAVAGLVLAAYQATPVKSPAAAVQPVTTQQTQPAKNTPAKANAHATATATVQTPERVTITGCLEQGHDGFRLKNTEGADAPKSRNWKTGFITKHPASLNLQDQKNRMKLGTHVGERVSVTGMLTDRDLEVRSMTRVANSCE